MTSDPRLAAQSDTRIADRIADYRETIAAEKADRKAGSACYGGDDFLFQMRDRLDVLLAEQERRAS